MGQSLALKISIISILMISSATAQNTLNYTIGKTSMQLIGGGGQSQGYTFIFASGSPRGILATQSYSVFSPFETGGEAPNAGPSGEGSRPSEGGLSGIQVPLAIPPVPLPPSAKEKPKEKKTSEQILKEKPSNIAKEKESLFDIAMELVSQRPGKILEAKILLINFGRAGRTEVDLYYEIRDEEKKIVYAESSKIQVETQTEFIKSINISDLKKGNYEIFSRLTYEGQKQPAEVSIPFEVSGNSDLPIATILILFAVILIGVIAYSKRKNFNFKGTSVSEDET